MGVLHVPSSLCSQQQTKDFLYRSCIQRQRFQPREAILGKLTNMEDVFPTINLGFNLLKLNQIDTVRNT